MRNACRRILERAGFQVVEASDGSAGLGRARRQTHRPSAHRRDHAGRHVGTRLGRTPPSSLAPACRCCSCRATPPTSSPPGASSSPGSPSSRSPSPRPTCWARSGSCCHDNWGAEPKPPVLVVDDDGAIRRMIARILERAGYTCSEAPDPNEARLLAQAQEFALVTCDVNMPGGSGLGLVGDLRARHPDIAVLMVSGMDDPRTAATATGAGRLRLRREALRDQRDAHRRRQRAASSAAGNRESCPSPAPRAAGGRAHRQTSWPLSSGCLAPKRRCGPHRKRPSVASPMPWSSAIPPRERISTG